MEMHKAVGAGECRRLAKFNLLPLVEHLPIAMLYLNSWKQTLLSRGKKMVVDRPYWFSDMNFDALGPAWTDTW